MEWLVDLPLLVKLWKMYMQLLQMLIRDWACLSKWQCHVFILSSSLCQYSYCKQSIDM